MLFTAYTQTIDYALFNYNWEIISIRREEEDVIIFNFRELNIRQLWNLFPQKLYIVDFFEY